MEENTHSISFTSSHLIWLHGFEVFAGDGRVKYKYTVTEGRGVASGVVAEGSGSISRGSPLSALRAIRLQRPVLVLPSAQQQRWHTINLWLKPWWICTRAVITAGGTDGLPTVFVPITVGIDPPVQVRFNFDSGIEGSGQTTVARGQIASLIFEPVRAE